MKNSTLFLRGFLHALGVSAYVFSIALFMKYGERFFPEVDNNLLAPLVFILLFVFSALVTGSLVLAKPIMLYMDGKKKEGFRLFLFTGLNLFLCLLVFLFLMITV